MCCCHGSNENDNLLGGRFLSTSPFHSVEDNCRNLFSGCGPWEILFSDCGADLVEKFNAVTNAGLKRSVFLCTGSHIERRMRLRIGKGRNNILDWFKEKVLPLKISKNKKHFQLSRVKSSPLIWNSWIEKGRRGHLRLSGPDQDCIKQIWFIKNVSAYFDIWDLCLRLENF